MLGPELSRIEEKELDRLIEADIDFCKENAYLHEIVKGNDAIADEE